MLARMPWTDFLGWLEFDREDPIGGRRLDLLAGVVCSWIYEVNRGKNSSSYPLSKFVPDWSGTREMKRVGAEGFRRMKESAKVWAGGR